MQRIRKANAALRVQRVNRSSLSGRRRLNAIPSTSCWATFTASLAGLTRLKHYPSPAAAGLGYYHDVPFGTGPSLPLFALPVADMIVRKPQNDRCTFPEFAGDFGRAMMQPHNALYDR
jgi:hypothetical protein